MQTTRITTTLLATVAASLAVAGPARADSLVYLKGGDVFLTTTDAARQFQVTTGGGYTAVSQADDGTILATTATNRLRRLDRMGTVLSDIGTIAGGSTSSFTFKGPFDADISPNGQKVGYGYVYSGYTSTGGGTWVNEGNATAFAKAGSETTSSDAGFKSSREYDAPEWIDDSTVLLSNGPGYPSKPFAWATAGSGDSHSWFADPYNPHPHDATISRNKRWIAATNADRNELDLYRVTNATVGGPVDTCFYYAPEHAGMRYSSPTFNADGTVIAFADGEGLQIAAMGDGSAACPDGQKPRRVLPGASSPDWGPADVPAGPGVGGAAGGGASGGGGSTSGSGAGASGPGGAAGGPAAPAGPSLSLRRGTTLAGVLRSGLRVRLSGATPGRTTVVAKVGRTTIASGHVTVGRGGLGKATLRLTAAGRKRLAGRRTATVQLTAGPATASVTLRR